MTNERDVDGIRDVFAVGTHQTATLDGLLIEAHGIDEIVQGWVVMCAFMDKRQMYVEKSLVTAGETTIVNGWVGTIGGRKSARGLEVWKLDDAGTVVDQRLYGLLDARPSSPVQGLRMLLAHPRTALAFSRSRGRG
jgi:hypothetical protein